VEYFKQIKMGIGDWGLGIWGFGGWVGGRPPPTPPPTPTHNTQKIKK